MKTRSTLRLLAVVIILAGIVRLVEHTVPSTDVLAERAVRMFSFSSDEITGIAIRRGDLKLSCKKRAGGWYMEKPVLARVDDSRMNRILSEIEAMQKTERISLAQRIERDLRLKDYALDEPRAAVIVTLPGAVHELLIGTNAPLGNFLYVKLAASDEVAAVQPGILDALPERIEDIRDRVPLLGDVPRTSRVEIHGQGGFVQLAQAGGEWTIQQPEIARADTRKISQMMSELYGARIKRFIRDPVQEDDATKAATDTVKEEPASKLEPYGLVQDQAAARITVWVRGNDVGQGLILGKPAADNADEVYAKTRDSESVFTVGRSLLDVFTVAMNDLRDKNIFQIEPADIGRVVMKEGENKLSLGRRDDGGWDITEPAMWRADKKVADDLVRAITRLKAESFMDPSVTNLAEAGVTPPWLLIKLVPLKETAKCSTNWLMVGAVVEGKADVAAAFEGSESIYRIPAGALSGIGPTPSDPLAFRDRTMFSSEPEAIERITLQRGKLEQTVTRDDTGKWVIAAPETNRQGVVTVPPSGGNVVDEEVVEDVLLYVENLRAQRIEGPSQGSIAGFGLEVPASSLTIGLKGKDSIQKTLRFGFLAGTDGVYAMVQGEDMVFVLEKGLVERLTRSIIRPPAVPAEKKERAGPVDATKMEPK